MNNGEREFNELLTSVEKELTALKTSHKHPLGSIDFFTKTETISVSLSQQYGIYAYMFWVDVHVEAPTVTPPIVQIGWDVPSGFNYIDLYDYDISDSYATWSYKMFLQSPSVSSASFKVTATSSLPIISIQSRSAS